jgi:hypothetical protein
MERRSEPLDVKGCSLWRLPNVVDPRGKLTIAELHAMPFPVRRVFFVSAVPANKTRGHNAHKSCKELIYAINGSVAVAIDDGVRKQEVILKDCNIGLVVGPKIWCVQSRFYEGVVLVVFASEPYDANDYITDYAEFRSMAAIR